MRGGDDARLRADAGADAGRAGRHDLHTFVAEAGDRVWLMSRPTGGDGFVAALRVYDPNGTLILDGITGRSNCTR